MLSHCIAAENRKLRGSPIWVVFFCCRCCRWRTEPSIFCKIREFYALLPCVSGGVFIGGGLFAAQARCKGITLYRQFLLYFPGFLWYHKNKNGRAMP